MEAYAKTYNINGITCVTQVLSVSKNKSIERRGMLIVCDKDGNIKESVKNIETESDENYEYDEVAYVEFTETDRYINCEMSTWENEDGTKGRYLGVLIYDYGFYDEMVKAVRLFTNNDCIMITTVKNEYTLDKDYNTFDFDNINSYKEFGVYAEAVMTVVQRVKQYKD